MRNWLWIVLGALLGLVALACGGNGSDGDGVNGCTGGCAYARSARQASAGMACALRTAPTTRTAAQARAATCAGDAFPLW